VEIITVSQLKRNSRKWRYTAVSFPSQFTESGILHIVRGVKPLWCTWGIFKAHQQDQARKGPGRARRQSGQPCRAWGHV